VNKQYNKIQTNTKIVEYWT